jgi:hypothetical protein
MIIEGRVIRGVDINCSEFRKSFKRLSEPRQLEVAATLRSLLLLELDKLPAKLHMHQLHKKPVTSRLQPNTKVSAWTLHVTADDRYKASFTFEDGVMYFRLCDEHDVIDKNP